MYLNGSPRFWMKIGNVERYQTRKQKLEAVYTEYFRVFGLEEYGLYKYATM